MEFVYFHDKKTNFRAIFVFFSSDVSQRAYFIFFLWQGQKDLCQSYSTKEYTECRLLL